MKSRKDFEDLWFRATDLYPESPLHAAIITEFMEAIDWQASRQASLSKLHSDTVQDVIERVADAICQDVRAFQVALETTQ